MSTAPRVAFFTDSFLEINGVARTSQQLVGFAKDRALPMLCVHAGPATRAIPSTGEVTRVELERGRLSWGLERDLRFDLRLWRHARFVRAEVEAFRPDVIHLTGPSDVGQLGAYLAHAMGIPLVASWHTNVHDFAEARLRALLRWAPAGPAQRLSAAAGRHSLTLVLDFYRMARVLLAPNDELADLLRRATNRPVRLMARGVDTRLFTPRRRTRTGGDFVIGYVGRLSPEKSVRQLAALESILVGRGTPPFRFVIVGDGSERASLAGRMTRADFPGVLTGDALATAYANFDVFVFPSDTDTYGNVIQEAFASGVPVIVTGSGGPRYLVQEGVNGFIRPDVIGQADAIREVMQHPERAVAMCVAARGSVRDVTWSRVFERVYDAYEECLQGHRGGEHLRGHDRRDLSWLARLVSAGLANRRRTHQAPAAA